MINAVVDGEGLEYDDDTVAYVAQMDRKYASAYSAAVKGLSLIHI